MAALAGEPEVSVDGERQADNNAPSRSVIESGCASGQHRQLTRIRQARAGALRRRMKIFRDGHAWPGCYELFQLPYEHSCKRFCSMACRLALRRVVDREERYQARRRRMRCERVTRQAQSPDTS